MINIERMTLSDYELIKDSLIEEFDEFWKPSILKSELENLQPMPCLCVVQVGEDEASKV